MDNRSETEFWPFSLVRHLRRHIVFSELQDLFFVPDRLWMSSHLLFSWCQCFVLCHYRPFHPSQLSQHRGEEHVIDADHSGRRDMEPSRLVSYSCSVFSWPVYWAASWSGANDGVVWNSHLDFHKSLWSRTRSALSDMGLLNPYVTSVGFPSSRLFRNVYSRWRSLFYHLKIISSACRVCSYLDQSSHLDILPLDIQNVGMLRFKVFTVW